MAPVRADHRCTPPGSCVATRNTASQQILTRCSATNGVANEALGALDIATHTLRIAERHRYVTSPLPRRSMPHLSQHRASIATSRTTNICLGNGDTTAMQRLHNGCITGAAPGRKAFVIQKCDKTLTWNAWPRCNAVQSIPMQRDALQLGTTRCNSYIAA